MTPSVTPRSVTAPPSPRTMRSNSSASRPPSSTGSGALATSRILYSPAVVRRLRLAMQMTGAPTGREWAELARRFEAGGYDTISLPDHLGDQFAAVPALAAIAMV